MNKKDDSNDIKQLFERISGHFSDAQEGSKEMFAMLVDVTLKYRDRLEKAGSDPLTISETREALDGFMYVLRERKFPSDLTPRVHALVVRWLEQLKDKLN